MCITWSKLILACRCWTCSNFSTSSDYENWSVTSVHCAYSRRAMQQGGLFCWVKRDMFMKSHAERVFFPLGTALSRRYKAVYVSKKWTLKKLWREGWEGLFVFLGEVKSCRMEFTPADFAGCIGCHFKVSDTLKSRRSLWIQHRVISHIKNTASTWYFVCSLVGCRLTWKTWSCFIFLFFCVCLVVLLMQQHPGEAFKVEKQNSIFSFELFFKWADFLKYLAVLFGINVRLQLLICLASDLRGGWIDTGWQKLLFPLEIN